jgi:hypothetical protein
MVVLVIFLLVGESLLLFFRRTPATGKSATVFKRRRTLYMTDPLLSSELSELPSELSCLLLILVVVGRGGRLLLLVVVVVLLENLASSISILLLVGGGGVVMVLVVGGGGDMLLFPLSNSSNFLLTAVLLFVSSFLVDIVYYGYGMGIST